MGSGSPGQRKTRQRDAILRVIAEAAGPLTVEEIHVAARQDASSLGIATVYRNVKLLLEAGRLQPVVMPTGETRYEATGLGHHHHFQCMICDSVYDLPDCHLNVPHGEPYAGGFVVEDHEITLYGTCPSCRHG